MIGYDRRPVEAMKKETETSFEVPTWILKIVLIVFAVQIIINHI